MQPFWPEADAGDQVPRSGWPRVLVALSTAQDERAAARKALLTMDQEELFVLRGQSLGLVPETAPGLLLSALRECGDRTCSCCRRNQFSSPNARRQFCVFVVDHLLKAFMSFGPITYVSLGSGKLLTDAQLLAAFLEGGGLVERVVLVDSQYGIQPLDYVPALDQFAAFFAPTPCVAYASLRQLLEEASSSPSTEGSIRAHALVACDAGTAISKGLKRSASVLLAEGGVAATLMNGGRFGSTTRAFIRARKQAERATMAEAEAGAATPWAGGGDPVGLQPAESAQFFGLEEIAVPRDAEAGPPFPPHLQW